MKKHQARHFEYDMKKADWLLHHGCIAIGCGFNSKTQSNYIIFKVTKRYKETSLYYDEIIGNKNIPNNTTILY